MKKQRRKKLVAVIFIIILVVAGLVAVFGTHSVLRFLWDESHPSHLQSFISESLIHVPASSGSPQPKADQPIAETPKPTPSPTPTPIPYPPAGYHCTKLPILMYHHVQPLNEAKALGHASLTVDRDIFSHQMQYLADKGYTVTTLRTLSDYFDGKVTLPKKPVILTFDDGYDDFHTYAVPILESHHFQSELFVPTGLMENSGYLTWSSIKDASTKGVNIDHHTWSHANVARANETFFHQEFDIATQQLTEHGYGPVTIFAYPYGTHNGRDVLELIKRGFTIAVTTLPGSTQCKEDRFALHRTRVGNSSLSAYGL